MRLFHKIFMLKKLKAIIIAVSLLIANVFSSAFAGVVVFNSLNFGNEKLSDINMVKQYNQIVMMPSKFIDMCVVVEKEITSLGFSNEANLFITKQVVDNVNTVIMFMNYRLNNYIKYVKFYYFKVSDNILNNYLNFMLFLIMLSFIVGYLGLLTAKNKGNYNIKIIESIKLCPVF